MDNTKTGAFIRELRKEQNMTQRDLADRLHITDRAVSKWERGLSAPDIALLEPLARALGVSVPELLEGERTPPAAFSAELEARTQAVLDYSKSEVARKTGAFARKYLRMTALLLVLALTAGGFFLLRSGYPFIIDRKSSPDGSVRVTVYSKSLNGGSFSMEDGVSVIMRLSGGGEYRTTYRGWNYEGLWWAPDNRKCVTALNRDGESWLVLERLDNNCGSNLTAYLSIGVERTELSKQYGYKSTDGWPDIRYQFLQWGRDSVSMLIYYTFDDSVGAVHDGYFWYNCETGTVSAILELSQ